MNDRMARVVQPEVADGPYFIFLTLRHPKGETYEDYRLARIQLLRWYCMVARHLWPSASKVVGIATEPGFDDNRTEDLTYLDGRNWTPEHDAEAKRLQREFKILTNVQRTTSASLSIPGGGMRSSRRGEAATGRATVAAERSTRGATAHRDLFDMRAAPIASSAAAS